MRDMGWESRDYGSDEYHAIDGRGGGRGWRSFGRVGGRWDDIFSWALTIGRVFGIRVRLHLAFILFIIGSLLRALATEEGVSVGQSVGFSAAGLACLFGIVLLHEFGHCFACRAAGGEADDILMWPLGGLATCRPPHVWKAYFITAAGGPLVNVVICVLLSPVIIAITGSWNTVFFNLFDPNAGYRALIISGEHHWWLTALWWTNYTSLVLLLFNLIPMYPLDGAQLAQALAWPKMGYRRSREVATALGYAGAAVVGLVAILAGALWLLLIAIFGGLASWIERRRLAFTDSEFGAGSPLFGMGGGIDGGTDFSASLAPDAKITESPRAEKQRQKREARDRADAAALDDLLEKISRDGIGSLTHRERKILERATEKRRRDSVK